MSATVEFLSTVCGWRPRYPSDDYAELSGGGIDATVQGDEQSSSPLLVIRVADLEQARAEVEAAGGVVTYGPFEIPGGRRFHFREPGGNEIAMWMAVPD